MLTRQYRLPGGYRFKASDIRRTPYFLLKVAKNDLLISRFGFVISKRIDKRATERNRIRRALSSVIVDNVSGLNGGYDMLFIVQPGASGQEAAVLREEVRKVLKATRVLS